MLIYSIFVAFFNVIDLFGFKEYSSARSQDYALGVLFGDLHEWFFAERDDSLGDHGDGISNAAQHTSEDCNGVGPLRDGKRDCVAVVLFGDQSLKHLDLSWPISQRQHGIILKKILSYRPKAVLVDFLFLDDREDEASADDYLEKTIRLYNRRKVPLYFLGNNIDSENPISKKPFGLFFDDKGDQIRCPNGKPKFDKIRIAWGPLNLDHGVARYYQSHIEIDRPSSDKGPTPGLHPHTHGTRSVDESDTSEDCRETEETSGPQKERKLPDEAESAQKQAENRPLTAAFQIWNDICLEQNRPEDCDWKDSTKNIDLALIYGAPVHPINAKWMLVKSSGGSTFDHCRQRNGPFSNLFLALINSDTLWPNCPYIGEVPVEELVQSYDEDIDRVLRGHIVVYGARMAGLGDVYQTPIHGLQPGARIHAIALDNLFVYGQDGFKRQYPSDFLSASEKGYTRIDHYRFGNWLYYILFDFLAILIATTIFIFAYELTLQGFNKKKFDNSVIRRVSLHTVMSFLVALLTSAVFLLLYNIWLFLALNFPPINWVGMLVGISIGSLLNRLGLFDATIDTLNRILRHPRQSPGDSR